MVEPFSRLEMGRVEAAWTVEANLASGQAPRRHTPPTVAQSATSAPSAPSPSPLWGTSPRAGEDDKNRCAMLLREGELPINAASRGVSRSDGVNASAKIAAQKISHFLDIIILSFSIFPGLFVCRTTGRQPELSFSPGWTNLVAVERRHTPSQKALVFNRAKVICLIACSLR